MNLLTWHDLFVDASLLDFNALLSEWAGLKVGEIRPIGASAFGDLFFERRSGEVMKLDMLEGRVHPVAVSFQQFGELMNSPEWQEQHLLSQGVALLKEKGGSRGPNQFFGFVPHPSFVGKIDWAKVMPLDAVVWNSICAQTLGTALPEDPAMPDVPYKRPWWKLGKGYAEGLLWVGNGRSGRSATGPGCVKTRNPHVFMGRFSIACPAKSP